MENLPVVGENIYFPGAPAKDGSVTGARSAGTPAAGERAQEGSAVGRFLSQLKLGRPRSMTEELLFPGLKEAIKFVDNVTAERERKNQTVPISDTDTGRTLVMRGRRKYFVRDGDSLLSIALEQLSDERFARLLITINRAELKFGDYESSEDTPPMFDRQGNLMPPVFEEQMLWLPSDHELEVHRRHYFTREETGYRNRSGQNQRTDRKPEPTRVSGCFDDGPATVITQREAGEKSCSRARSDSTRLSHVLSKVRFAGDRRSIDLGQIDCSVPTSNESRLIEKLANVVEANDHKQQDGEQLAWSMRTMPPHEETDPEAKVSVEHLTKTFRLLCLERASEWFSIKLQTELVDGRWLTIAAYDCHGSRIVRRIDKVDGSRSYLDVALPPAVARQMAREDFSRNWQSYFERFKTERRKLRS